MTKLMEEFNTAVKLEMETRSSIVMVALQAVAYKNTI